MKRGNRIAETGKGIFPRESAARTLSALRSPLSDLKI